MNLWLILTQAGQETMTLIDTIQQETKATVLIIEHRLEDVLCESVDRIIVMNEGHNYF